MEHIFICYGVGSAAVRGNDEALVDMTVLYCTVVYC